MKRWTYNCKETGPGTLAGRYLRMFWQPVRRIQDTLSGQSLPIRIMGENFTLYCGASGRHYIVADRCAHRGAPLSVGWVEGEEIRCRYHGWKFSGSGQCSEQPGEGEYAFCSRVKIRHIPVTEYMGMVFGYFGDGEPPPFPRYQELDGGGVIRPAVYRRNCNIANILDNLLDEVHVAFVHRQAFGRIPEIPIVTVTRTEFGAVSYCKRPGGVRVTEFLMPNVLRLSVPTPFEGVPWGDAVTWRVPIDDGAHLAFSIQRYELEGELKQKFLDVQAKMKELPVPPMLEMADRVIAGEMTVEQAKAALPEHDPMLDVSFEDHVVMHGQGVVADWENETLGRSDVGVYAIRDLWHETLEVFADTGSVPKWVQPPNPVTTSGDGTQAFA